MSRDYKFKKERERQCEVRRVREKKRGFRAFPVAGRFVESSDPLALQATRLQAFLVAKRFSMAGCA